MNTKKKSTPSKEEKENPKLPSKDKLSKSNQQPKGKFLKASWAVGCISIVVAYIIITFYHSKPKETSRLVRIR
jgi:hypothetical protein